MPKSKLAPFTVISFDDDNKQLNCHHTKAASGLNAFQRVAKECRNRDLAFVAALPGHLKEAQHQITFPGEGLVYSETVIEQNEVFGPSA